MRPIDIYAQLRGAGVDIDQFILKAEENENDYASLGLPVQGLAAWLKEKGILRNGGQGFSTGGNGLGVATAGAGGAATSYGGGGGGAMATSTAQTGGAGYAGLIRIWEFA